jgi:hypothetical protein
VRLDFILLGMSTCKITDTGVLNICISYTEFSAMMYKFGALSTGRIISALFYAEIVNYDRYVRQIP